MALRVARQSLIFIMGDFDGAWGLVSGHYAKNGHTNRTLYPSLLAHHIPNAFFVVVVTAGQRYQVLRDLLLDFLLNIPNFEGLQTDWAHLLLHFGLAEDKLQSGVISEGNLRSQVFNHTLFLLADELDQKLNTIIEFIIRFQLILAIQENLDCQLLLILLGAKGVQNGLVLDHRINIRIMYYKRVIS